MTYIHYAHIADNASGVSDPASFPIIPRVELTRVADALGPAVVHASCSCGAKIVAAPGVPGLNKAIEDFATLHRGCR